MKHTHVTTWDPTNVKEIRMDGSLVKWKVGRVSLIWTEEVPKKKSKIPTNQPGPARKSRL